SAAPSRGTLRSVIGPPIAVSRSAASRMARSSAGAASRTVTTRPFFDSNHRRKPGESLLAKYPDLRHDCGSTGTFAQIVGSPFTNPAESMKTFVVFRRGYFNATSERISFGSL